MAYLALKACIIYDIQESAMGLVGDAHSAHLMQRRNAKSTFRCVVIKVDKLPKCLKGALA